MEILNKSLDTVKEVGESVSNLGFCHKEEDIAKLGPCGGVGGADFAMYLLDRHDGHGGIIQLPIWRARATLAKLKIWHSDIIGKIQVGVTYDDADPQGVHWLDPWGDAGWGRFYRTSEIDLGGSDVVSVEGTIGKVVYLSKYYNVVTSIKFTTSNPNLKPPSYGMKTGKKFILSAPKEGGILGFFGRAGDVVDAVGVYTLHGDHHCEVSPAKLGPCGGAGGDDFDMNLSECPALKKIKVWYSEDNIGGIQVAVTSKDDPEEHWLDRWGKASLSGDYEAAEISLQCHHLQKIEGTVDEVKGAQVLTSITFATVQIPPIPIIPIPIFGPKTYGTSKGKHFVLTAGKGKVVGFFGHASDAVDAIGIYAGK